MTVERCDECRFDGAHYDRLDTRRSLTTMAVRWRWAAAGIDESVLATRPAPAVWSATEYAIHAGDVVETMSRLVRAMTKADMPPIDAVEPVATAVDDPPPRMTFAEAADRLEANTVRMDAEIKRLTDADWSKTVTIGADVRDVMWVARHAVHDSSHHLADIARGLHALGRGAPRGTGVVAGVFASGGGVPKQSLTQAVVGYRGVDGDRQAAREHHGRV